jgi:hypothetical protein
VSKTKYLTQIFFLLLLLVSKVTAIKVYTTNELNLSINSDGSVNLQSRETVSHAQAVMVLADCNTESIVVSRSDGRIIRPLIKEISRAKYSHRIGFEVSQADLQLGITISESGERVSPASTPLLSQRDHWAAHYILRIEIKNPGIYKITSEYLQEHLPDNYPDPREWVLVHNGQVEPLRVVGAEDGSFDPGDRVEFWGEPSLPDLPELGPDMRQDPWTAWEVYFIAHNGDQGSRFAWESGEIVEINPDNFRSSNTFPWKEHIEKDESYRRLGNVLEESTPDHLLWTNGIHSDDFLTVDFLTPEIDEFNSLPIKLKVCFRGLSSSTDWDGDPINHVIRLFVNGQSDSELEIGTNGDWINQQFKIVEFGQGVFPDHSTFEAAGNQLFIAGESDSINSIVALNWIDVEYERFFNASENRLLFNSNSLNENQLVDFVLHGFTGPDITIYKIGNSILDNLLIRQETDGYRVRFQDVFLPDTRYFAVEESAKYEPPTIKAVQYNNITSSSHEGDYVVVVADSLIRGAENELDDLLNGLTEDGFSPVLVSDRWIYDEFSHGKVRPHAIRDFMYHIWSAWNTEIKYLLLIGDGRQIQRVLVPTEDAVLPLWYKQAYRWGATSDDDKYVSADNGTQLPVIVGRWPIANPEELQNMVNKIAGYRNSEPGPWCNSALMVAGAQAGDAGIFQNYTEQLIITSIPEQMFVRRIEAGETGERYIGSNPELTAFLNQGQLITNYSGHGGGAVWSDNSLLSSEDVIHIDNQEKLSFFTNATCYIASLENQSALGRALLNDGYGGAIGVLGSTGLGFQLMGFELITEFYRYLLANNGLSVGEALRLSKNVLWMRHIADGLIDEQTFTSQAVNAMNTILGLPSQKLKSSQPTTRVQLENPQVNVGDVLHVSGKSGQANASGVVEIYSSASHPVQSSQDFVNDVIQYDYNAGADSSWQIDIPYSGDLYRGSYFGTVRVWDDANGGGYGNNWFYPQENLDRVLFHEAVMVPEFPTPVDSFQISLRFASLENLDSMNVNSTFTFADNETLVFTGAMNSVEADPQLFVSEKFAPVPDKTRVDFVFEANFAESQESAVAWFMIENPTATIEMRFLGYGQEYGGQLDFSFNNMSDTNSAGFCVTVLNADADSLDCIIIPEIVQRSRLDHKHFVSSGQLGDSLFFEADSVNQMNLVGRMSTSLDKLYLRFTGADSTRRIDEYLGLQPNGLNDENIVEVAIAGNVSNQPGLLRENDGWIWRDIQANDVISLSGEIEVVYPDSSQIDKIQLLVYDANTGNFCLDENVDYFSVWQNDTLKIEFDNVENGLCLGSFSDETPPTIDVNVEGQVFNDGAYIPQTPVLSFIMRDTNGITTLDNSIFLLLDGEIIPAGDYSLSSVEDAGIVSLSYNPDLSDLNTEVLHDISLRCYDCAGNSQEASWQFKVSDDFDLLHIGNYPNPFRRDTRFVFSLSSAADEASLSIYTISGRIIRTLKISGPVIGYRELMWDGRDSRGERVANGVYFYRFVAKRGKSKIEHLGKIARLK